jgi:hypothetical protein
MAQVVDHLLSKYKTLSSDPSTAKTKQKNSSLLKVLISYGGGGGGVGGWELKPSKEKFLKLLL